MEKQQLPEVREEGRPDVDSEHQAALLIDFDNVTMGIRSNLGQELRNLLNSDVIRGKVAVQRAYADWRRYPQYIVPLSEASIDLIFAPAYGSSKKNATDIRLAIDALELVFIRPEIRTYILMSGDSDFSSLVLKLKEYGKYIIGVGIQESSSDLLVQNCDEYYSYTSLSGLRKEGEGPIERHDPWVLVEKAVAKMVKRGDTMRSDRLKQVMLEIDSTFDEKEQGFSKFNRFVVEAASRGLITIQKMENGQYGVAPAGGSKTERGEQKREEKKRETGGEDGKQGRRGGRRRRGEGEKTRAGAPKEPSGETAGTRRARPKLTMESALELLDKVLGQLLEGADDTVRDSDVKRRLLELHPQFDEGEIGFNKFSKFLQAAEESGTIELSRGPNGNYYVARRSRTRKRAKSDKKKPQQRKEEPTGTVETQDKGSTMRKLARFLFGESADAPPDERIDATRPPLEERTADRQRAPDDRERRAGRAERGERRRPSEARRGRREEARKEDRREGRRDRGGESRSERDAEGRDETSGRRERAGRRGDREPRAEAGAGRSPEAPGERRARGRQGGKRGRESRPESRPERARDRGGKPEPGAAQPTRREEEPSEPARQDRPAAEGAAVMAREKDVAESPDRAEASDREAPSHDSDEATAKQAADEPKREGEPGVVPAPMPGAPRGTIRGRYGSRGRYRPPTEAPPILEGQSKSAGDEQADLPGLTFPERREDSVESSKRADASASSPPIDDAPDEESVAANQPLVDRLTGYAGIGARTAERLVEAFGEDVIRVIDDQPERVRHLLPDHRAERVIRAREEERRLESTRDGED